MFIRFNLKNKKTCPLCRYNYGENSTPANIMQKSFQIVDIDEKLIKENIKRSKEEVYKICDQYFIIPEFGLLN